jgi:hypothetical protein
MSGTCPAVHDNAIRQALLRHLTFKRPMGSLFDMLTTHSQFRLLLIPSYHRRKRLRLEILRPLCLSLTLAETIDGDICSSGL